ncbi:MAG: GNAT family N-acetyltransferase [Erysipelotrichaceae bacterium]
MIITARTNDKPIIYKLWKQSFSFDDFGSIDDYFERNYNPNNTYINIINNNIVSTLTINYHNIILNNQPKTIIIISGVATLLHYKRKGYMNELILYILNKYINYDIFIQAYNPIVYKKYNIKEAFYNNIYSFNKSNRKEVCYSGYSFKLFNDDPNLLLQLYNKFILNYNTYNLRTIDYYINYIHEAKTQLNNLLIIYEHGIPIGYVRYYFNDNLTIIDEVVCSNAASINVLVNRLLEKYDKVEVHVANNIELENTLEYKKECNMYTLSETKVENGYISEYY